MAFGNLAAPTISPIEWSRPFPFRPMVNSAQPQARGGQMRTWLKYAGSSGMKHVCREGCMFPNVVFESAGAWNEVRKSMVAVDEAL